MGAPRHFLIERTKLLLEVFFTEHIGLGLCCHADRARVLLCDMLGLRNRYYVVKKKILYLKLGWIRIWIAHCVPLSRLSNECALLLDYTHPRTKTTCG